MVIIVDGSGDATTIARYSLGKSECTEILRVHPNMLEQTIWLCYKDRLESGLTYVFGIARDVGEDGVLLGYMRISWR